MTALLPTGTSDAVRRRIAPDPEEIRVPDPVAWVQNRLSEFLWSKQREILQALRVHRKVAVKACHGPGKSYTASRAGAWWIDGHPVGEATLLTTAPSSQQVRAILWSELGKAHRKGGLAGYITRGQVPEWIIDGQQVGFGRKPADYIDETEARTQFQGIHARYLLVALDEACGVPKWLWDATETLVTNEASRILAIGNPDDPTSHFAKVCAPGSGWHVIKISAFDTPAFTGEYVPEEVADSLVSRLWVEERRREWGEESPMYVSKVLGEFPEVSDDVIITPKLVREAHERDLTGQMIGERGRYGMDVARQGKDESCIYENRGGVIRLVDSWRKQDTVISTSRARNVLERDRYKPMTIDAVGLGWGVYDPLRHEGWRVGPFQGGEKAHDERRFANKNAEAWWAFREALEAGRIDLDETDDVLASQLQTRRWKLDAAQKRIVIESKEDMAKRGLPSPDRADAAVLSWYEGVSVPDPDVVMTLAPGETSSITGDLLTLAT